MGSVSARHRATSRDHRLRSAGSVLETNVVGHCPRGNQIRSTNGGPFDHWSSRESGAKATEFSGEFSHDLGGVACGAPKRWKTELPVMLWRLQTTSLKVMTRPYRVMFQFSKVVYTEGLGRATRVRGAIPKSLSLWSAWSPHTLSVYVRVAPCRGGNACRTLLRTHSVCVFSKPRCSVSLQPQRCLQTDRDGPWTPSTPSSKPIPEAGRGSRVAPGVHAHHLYL